MTSSHDDEPKFVHQCAEFVQECTKLGAQEIVPNLFPPPPRKIWAFLGTWKILFTFLSNFSLLMFLACLAISLTFLASFTSHMCWNSLVHQESCGPDVSSSVQAILCRMPPSPIFLAQSWFYAGQDIFSATCIFPVWMTSCYVPKFQLPSPCAKIFFNMHQNLGAQHYAGCHTKFLAQFICHAGHVYGIMDFFQSHGFFSSLGWFDASESIPLSWNFVMKPMCYMYLLPMIPWHFS